MKTKIAAMVAASALLVPGLHATEPNAEVAKAIAEIAARREARAEAAAKATAAAAAAAAQWKGAAGGQAGAVLERGATIPPGK